MASNCKKKHKNNNSVNSRDSLSVYGYIRGNFHKKCWIEEIMAIIIKFYKIKGGSLYVCGDGQYGKLGIKKYKNKYCKKTKMCPPFIENNAVKVSAGYKHTLILDRDGSVWCCGRGSYGQLGNRERDDLIVPTKLNLGIRVIAISAGGEHSLLLCEDGTVKGCGRSNKGQIAFQRGMTSVPTTIEKLKQHKVVQISAGLHHSAALTEDGVLFCFGANGNGMCGVGKKKGAETAVKTPTKVLLDDEIEFVECGNNHTLVISCKGLIYSFGSHFHGKLGHGTGKNMYTPTLIETLKEKRIKTCAAGACHSLCIDKEGIIWSFGNNDYGQCGLSEEVDKQTTPKMIEWFIRNRIKAEECFASQCSSSVIAEDGCLYVFGDNQKYQLGLKGDDEYFTPQLLSFPQRGSVQQISMGAEHTAVIFNLH